MVKNPPGAVPPKISLSQDGGAELALMGIIAAMIVVLLYPFLNDIFDESHYQQQRVCVLTQTKGNFDVTRNGTLKNVQNSSNGPVNLMVNYNNCGLDGDGGFVDGGSSTSVSTSASSMGGFGSSGGSSSGKSSSGSSSSRGSSSSGGKSPIN